MDASGHISHSLADAARETLVLHWTVSQTQTHRRILRQTFAYATAGCCGGYQAAAVMHAVVPPR